MGLGAGFGPKTSFQGVVACDNGRWLCRGRIDISPREGACTSPTGVTIWSPFRDNYLAVVEQRLLAGAQVREPQWSESLALGSRSFVDRVEATLKNRNQTEVLEPPTEGSPWILKEPNLLKDGFHDAK